MHSTNCLARKVVRRESLLEAFFTLNRLGEMRKHLIEKIKMPSDVVKEAMKIRCLDVLCIILRHEGVKYGIPYIRWTLENNQPDAIKEGWDVCLDYIERQWIRFSKSLGNMWQGWRNHFNGESY